MHQTYTSLTHEFFGAYFWSPKPVYRSPKCSCYGLDYHRPVALKLLVILIISLISTHYFRIYLHVFRPNDYLGNPDHNGPSSDNPGLLNAR